jgi:hypothetical protein
MVTSIENWGKDHWSLLVFIETQIVNAKNTKEFPSSKLDLTRMRVNSDKRVFTNGASRMGSTMSWRDTWGTKFKGGEILDPKHDDIDVLDELEESGFVKNHFTDMNPIVSLTKKGYEACNRIRKHKAEGGQFAQFIY